MNEEDTFADARGAVAQAVELVAKLLMERDGDDKETAIERAVDQIAFECDQYIDNPDFFDLD